MESALKDEIGALHLLRTIATTMIVALHVSAAYMVYSPPSSNAFRLGLILNQWSRISLPLFVFASGFGLFYGYGKAVTFNIGSFLKRRVSKVWVPYLVWSFIYLALDDLQGRSTGFLGLPLKQKAAEYLKWTFWGNVYTPLWFVLMISQFYLLFPLIRKKLALLQSPIRVLVIHFFIFLVLILYLTRYVHYTGFCPLDVLQKYYAETPLGWYYYFILGGVVALNWNRIKNIPLHAFGTVFFYLTTTVLVIAEAYYGFLSHGQYYLLRYGPIRPTVLINSMASLPCIYVLADRILKTRPVYGLCRSVSRYSYGVYFVHPHMLNVLKFILDRSGLQYTRAIHLFALLGATTILSLLFCTIIDRTPLRSIFLGVKS
ncbi:MAG TPA: acyltransferase [Firmicutes bacterium]|nr:acyltransferase [Bacillota bacterium]